MSKALLFTALDIGVALVDSLASRGDVELTVVTQETDRNEIYGYRSVVDHCGERGILALTPARLDSTFLEEVRRLKPDLIICAYYAGILPSDLISIPVLGCINVHPGKLPDYRGNFPTPWHILNNEPEIGITVHYIDRNIDTGDIIAQRMFPIGEQETGFELFRRAMGLSRDLLLETYPQVLAGKARARPQPPGGSYYNKLDPRYHVDWHQSRRDIQNQVRVHAKPYFPAYAFLMNKCLLINKVSFYDLPNCRLQSPGFIREIASDGKAIVSCADGYLLLDEVEMVPSGTHEELQRYLRVGRRMT